MRYISGLTMLDDDVVHTWGTWCTGETGQGEGAVGVGDVLIQQAFLSGP